MAVQILSIAQLCTCHLYACALFTHEASGRAPDDSEVLVSGDVAAQKSLVEPGTDVYLTVINAQLTTRSATCGTGAWLQDLKNPISYFLLPNKFYVSWSLHVIKESDM